MYEIQSIRVLYSYIHFMWRCFSAVNFKCMSVHLCEGCIFLKTTVPETLQMLGCALDPDPYTGHGTLGDLSRSDSIVMDETFFIIHLIHNNRQTLAQTDRHLQSVTMVPMTL